MSRSSFSVTRASALKVAAIPLLFGSGLGIGEAQSQGVIRLGVAPVDTFAEANFALDSGFFKAENLNVELTSITSGNAIVAAVAGGALDAGMASPAAIGTAFAQGIPISIFAPGALFSSKAPTTLLMVQANSPLRTAKDLEGKRVSVDVLSGLGKASVEQWMLKNGAEPSKVSYVEIPFSAAAASLSAGRIDAAFLAEPALSAAQGVRRLADTYGAIAPRWFISCWFATRDWLTKNADTARKLERVLLKTGTWANQHPRESAIILEKVTSLRPEVVTRMQRATYGDRLDVDMIQPVLDASYKAKILKSAVVARDMIAPGYG